MTCKLPCSSFHEGYCYADIKHKCYADMQNEINLSLVSSSLSLKTISMLEKEIERLQERLRVYECDNCQHLLTGMPEDAEVCQKCADGHI